MRVLTEPTPHDEAIRFLKDKPAVFRSVFDRLLPDLQARAFTIGAIEDANVLQRLRDRIADLPAGADWNEVKRDLVGEICPWLKGDMKDATRRAETLMRREAFMAYSAAQYNAMTETRAAFPYWQYVTIGDANVRDTHAALDGLVLPADSPFWDDHFPPWDWGCRCRVVPLSPEDVERIRGEDAGKAPELRRLIEGERLRAIERGDLVRGPVPLIDPEDPERQRVLDYLPGQKWNVLAPRETNKENAFGWNPGRLNMPLSALADHYDAAVFSSFRKAVEKKTFTDNDGRERRVVDWMFDADRDAARAEVLAYGRGGKELGVALDYRTGKVLGKVTGTSKSVNMDTEVAAARREGKKISIEHNHPNGLASFSLADLRYLIVNRDVIAQVGSHTHNRMVTLRIRISGKAAAEKLVERLDRLIKAEKSNKLDADQWRSLVARLRNNGVIEYEKENR